MDTCLLGTRSTETLALRLTWGIVLSADAADEEVISLVESDPVSEPTVSQRVHRFTPARSRSSRASST